MVKSKLCIVYMANIKSCKKLCWYFLAPFASFDTVLCSCLGAGLVHSFHILFDVVLDYDTIIYYFKLNYYIIFS